MKKSNPNQSELLLSISAKDSYATVFKKLYYHLYSNGNSSRAESIIEDLAKIILIKLAAEKHRLSFLVDDYLQGVKPATETLLPIFLAKFPELFSEDETFQLDDSSVRRCFRELEAISFLESQSHILGDAFQSLIGPVLRGDKGQFFTPKSVVKAMVVIANPSSYDKIIDPACGTGGFLLESYNHILSQDMEFKGTLIGIDKDKFLSKTAQCICEIFAPGSHTVVNANSLDLENLKRENPEIFDADVVLTNPPFGAKIGVTDKSILRQYDFGHNWSFSSNKNCWVKNNQVLSSQDPQILFIELCVKLLREGGRMGIVLPEGIFGNRGIGYIWDYLRANGKITAMIDCPRTTFQPSTDVKTNILFFQKKTASTVIQQDNFQVAIATHCGHDRRGRLFTEDGRPYPDDFPQIATDYFAEQPKWWATGVLKNQYYIVPRYCDTSAEKDLHLEFKGELMSLGEMVKHKYITIKKGNEVGSEAYGTGDIPFVRTSDISNLEVTNDPTKSVSEEIFEKFKKVQDIRENDILMVSDGRYRIGRVAIVLGNKVKCVVQSHLKIIRVLPGAPFTAFELLYLFNQRTVQKQIRNLVFIQSTLGGLGSRLNELLLPIPERNAEWQEKINDFETVVLERFNLLERIRQFQGDEII